MVSARRKKLGMNERKTFATQKEALDYRKQILENLTKYGAQPTIPTETKHQAELYGALLERLKAFGKRPEEAVDHYIKFLGEETIRQVKPAIRELADKWKDFKNTDKTLSRKTVIEIRSYARFIKSQWGDHKPDALKKNEIDLLIRGLKISNNTRRKYLRYIRMFFSWVKDEHLIVANPTDGIFYKPDDFNADFYDVPTTSNLLRYVVEHEKDLIGYYALLTFAGLRPSEGARVQWSDLSFKTSELYVRKGKTNARHIILEPVAVEWMRFHRENTPQGKPFIDLCSLENREKEVREATLNGDWVQDGLRHGFATYYKAKTKSIEKVSDYLGNSLDIVKRHYQRTVPAEDCEAFWNLTPAVVMAKDA